MAALYDPDKEDADEVEGAIGEDNEEMEDALMQSENAHDCTGAINAVSSLWTIQEESEPEADD